MKLVKTLPIYAISYSNLLFIQALPISSVIKELILSNMMGFMSFKMFGISDGTKEDSVKTPESDKRFVRPKRFKLSKPLDAHIEDVFQENKASMDVLAK